MSQVQVLLIDEDRGVTGGVVEVLAREGIKAEAVSSVQDASALLKPGLQLVVADWTTCNEQIAQLKVALPIDCKLAIYRTSWDPAIEQVGAAFVWEKSHQTDEFVALVQAHTS